MASKGSWAILLLLWGLVSAQNSSCITNPVDPSCVNYQPPKATITAATSSVCMMMGFMPGCTISNLCQKYNYTSRFCLPFSVYEDVCSGMMGMEGCSILSTMCAPNSVVKVCQTTALTLPDTEVLVEYIDGMCEEMPMAPCSQRNSSGYDYLTVYSQLCLSMPYMENCTDWNIMCKQIPDWSLCTNQGSSNPIPLMRMFFHWGIDDYILLKDWVPTTKESYAFAWVIVFAFTILLEFIKLMRVRAEKRWGEVEYVSLNDTGVLAGEAPFRFKIDFSRALLHTLEVAWGFIVMLVVMTFNIGLFFSVLAGTFIGMLLVGRFIPYVPKTSCH